MSIEERVAAVFAEAGVEGWLHARDVDTDRCVGVRADDRVVLASIVKIFIVLEFARQVEAGALDPTERVLVRTEDRLGGWGTSGCTDDIELSLRDLAYFAMTVSDNTAADVLLRRVGGDLLSVLAGELGLHRTRIVGGPRQLLESMFDDLGARDDTEFARLFASLPPEHVRTLRVFDPQRTTSSTPRELTRLLTLVWRDEAGPPAACATVRGLMLRQLFWTRLAAAFPAGVRVCGKTGTLPGWAMEAGVVEYADDRRIAVAVFVRSGELSRARTDAVLGQAALAAVEGLRELG